MKISEYREADGARPVGFSALVDKVFYVSNFGFGAITPSQKYSAVTAPYRC
jgi:hypothetical protein